jgi:hypothetical protein
MGIFIGILFVVFLLIAGGSYIASMFRKHKEVEDDQKVTARPSGCCGSHEVCESDILKLTSDEIIYFEDEELDRFKEVVPDLYKSEDIEEFRDVLYTLLPDDIMPWLESIEKRHILLPGILQQEARQLLSEAS